MKWRKAGIKVYTNHINGHAHLSKISDNHFYAPNFEEVEGAYWFGSFRAVSAVSQSVCDA